MSKSNYHSGTKESQCYFCGCGPPLREHHIIPQRFGGPDKPDNIVELCDLCHKRVERLYDKSFYEWFGINDQTGERKFHRQCKKKGCKNVAKMEVELFEEEYYEQSGMMLSSVPNPSWTDFLTWRKQTPNLHVDMDLCIFEGLYCRVCVAKYAKAAFDAIWGVYKKQMSELHEKARECYESGKEDSHWLDKKKFRTRPQFTSPEEIIEEIVVEEADD